VNKTMSEQQPKLEWVPIVELKRFPREGVANRRPKTLQLLTVSDKTFGVSMQNEEGVRIAMKLSRAEALDIAFAIIRNSQY
jgi:hypothetical protein